MFYFADLDVMDAYAFPVVLKKNSPLSIFYEKGMEL